MKSNLDHLYFVAVVPDEPVFSSILSLKNQVKDEFESKAALRSPPHITLHMPFNWPIDREQKLKNDLASLTQDYEPTRIFLKDFGAFEPKVIYVNVVENEALSQLQKGVEKQASAAWNIYPKPRSRGFNPHITIAFRDLKKPQFIRAWDVFKTKEYSGNFYASSIDLLRHNGKNWESIYRAPLGLTKP